MYNDLVKVLVESAFNHFVYWFNTVLAMSEFAQSKFRNYP